MRRLLFIAMLLAGLSGVCFGRDLAIIVNKANSVTALPLPQLVKLATAGTKTWPNGNQVKFIMRDPAQPGMRIALEKLFGMSAENLRTMVAANPGHFMILDSDEKVVKTVAATPGALGLIDIYSVTGGVNVVKVNGKLPFEQGYLLHTH
jgi:ABC-type phosphate transport system substrate-binding protein